MVIQEEAEREEAWLTEKQTNTLTNKKNLQRGIVKFSKWESKCIQSTHNENVQACRRQKFGIAQEMT